MRPLSLSSLNPALQKVEYAVRGELAIKAEDYRQKLEQGNANLPFDRIINSNIGNPQQKGLEQPPLTFVRQVSINCLIPTIPLFIPNKKACCANGVPCAS